MTFKKRLYTFVFKWYWRAFRYFHPRIEARLTIPIFDGLHPYNVFYHSGEFFVENVCASDVVLDVACGTGKLLHTLAPKITSGYGIEIHDGNYGLCKKLHAAPNITYHQGDLYKTDYRKLKAEIGYTVATFTHILEHVEDVPKILKTVDAPVILICVPSQENWQIKLLMHLGLPYIQDATHFREYTRDMLREELKMASYQVEFIGFNGEGHIVSRARKMS